jgi:hypothetical protein
MREEALRDFGAAHEKIGSAPSAVSLAYCYSVMRHHKDARKNYGKAIEKGLSSPAVRNNLAYSLCQRDYFVAGDSLKPEEAIRELLQAITDSSPAERSNLGPRVIEYKEPRDAISELLEATDGIELPPDSRPFWYNLMHAQLKRAQQRAEQTISKIEHYYKCLPSSAGKSQQESQTQDEQGLIAEAGKLDGKAEESRQEIKELIKETRLDIE